jgi:hypothetical protein
MEHEGMVHALEETRRLLKRDGVLVNILPDAEGEFIEVHQEGRVLFSEHKREAPSENVLKAEAAIQEVLERGLLVMEQEEAFEFRTYGSSVAEMRAYWKEQNAHGEPRAKEVHEREESLYAQVEEILDEGGEGAEIVFREWVRIARLRPVK